jgi:hypothetical protein
MPSDPLIGENHTRDGLWLYFSAGGDEGDKPASLFVSVARSPRPAAIKDRKKAPSSYAQIPHREEVFARDPQLKT